MLMICSEAAYFSAVISYCFSSLSCVVDIWEALTPDCDMEAFSLLLICLLTVIADLLDNEPDLFLLDL